MGAPRTFWTPEWADERRRGKREQSDTLEVPDTLEVLTVRHPLWGSARVDARDGAHVSFFSSSGGGDDAGSYDASPPSDASGENWPDGSYAACVGEYTEAAAGVCWPPLLGEYEGSDAEPPEDEWAPPPSKLVGEYAGEVGE